MACINELDDIFVGNKDWKEMLQVCCPAIY